MEKPKPFSINSKQALHMRKLEDTQKYKANRIEKDLKLNSQQF